MALQQVLHLYETKAAEKVLSCATLAVNELDDSFTGHVADNSVEEHVEQVTDPLDVVHTISDKMFCSYCQCAFQDRTEQVAHYKTDWHRFNLKQKLKGFSKMVSIEEFEDIASDISSISGSDSEDDSPGGGGEILNVDALNSSFVQESGLLHIEGVGKHYPHVYIRTKESGELLSVYRCVIHAKKAAPETREELTSMIHELPSQTNWAVMMCAGGHFAAAVFFKGEMVAHKTFHRYVVRAKRGTAQSTRDNQGNAPKSGGASLRRYNEAALQQDISETIHSWSDKLSACHRIFIRCPTSNRNMFFNTYGSNKTPTIDKQDTRIRPIPFQTRRPTLKEVKRVHDCLSTLQNHGNVSLVDHLHLTFDDVTHKSQDQQSSPKVMASKSARDKRRTERFIGGSDTSSSDEGEYDLVMSEVVVDTSELKMFDTDFKPAARRKKGKHKDGSGSTRKYTARETMEPTDKEKQVSPLANQLYTLCKTGNITQLTQLLSSSTENVQQKPETTDDTETQHTPTTTDTETQLALTTNAKIQHTPTTNAEAQHTPTTNAETQHTPTANTEAQHTPTTTDAEIQQTENSETTTTADTQNKTTTDADTRNESKTIADMLHESIGDNERTMLHVAAMEGHKDVVRLLLDRGLDPAKVDKQNKTAYDLSSNKQTRDEFRRYMADYPDKFDYKAAKIPSPLTEEMAQERKTKEAAKKKAMKQAKKERLKVKNAELAVQRAEEKERQQFLQLSEREKRALAAERRLLAQATQQGQPTPVLSRCWFCASDMTGKIPFEYFDYKFCSPKCLKNHKQQKKS